MKPLPTPELEKLIASATPLRGSPEDHDGIHLFKASGRFFCKCDSHESLDLVEYSVNHILEIQKQRDKLRRLAFAALRVQNLTKENYPHRSPEWVFNHPDTPMRLAMNNLLDEVDKFEKSLKESGCTSQESETPEYNKLQKQRDDWAQQTY